MCSDKILILKEYKHKYLNKYIKYVSKYTSTHFLLLSFTEAWDSLVLFLFLFRVENEKEKERNTKQYIPGML